MGLHSLVGHRPRSKYGEDLFIELLAPLGLRYVGPRLAVKAEVTTNTEDDQVAWALIRNVFIGSVMDLQRWPCVAELATTFRGIGRELTLAFPIR